MKDSLFFIVVILLSSNVFAQSKFEEINLSYLYYYKHANEYLSQSSVELLDSVKTFVYQTDIEEWEDFRIKRYYTYDVNCNLLQLEEYNVSGISGSGVDVIDRIIFHYDDENRLIGEEQQKTKFMSSSVFQNRFFYEIKYNSNNQIEKIIQKRWSEEKSEYVTNDYISTFKVDFEYYSNLQLKKASTSWWGQDSMKYQLFNSYEFKYDEIGRQVEEIMSARNCNTCEFTKRWRYEFVFDEFGDMVLEKYEKLNSETSEWFSFYHIESSYDSLHRKISETKFWLLDGVLSNYSYKKKFTYDELNDDLTEIYYEYITTQEVWIQREKKSYHHNDDGFVLQDNWAFYSFTLDDWSIQEQNDFTFNNRNNKIQRIFNLWLWPDGLEPEYKEEYYWSTHIQGVEDNVVECINANPYVGGLIECINLPLEENLFVVLYDMLGRQIMKMKLENHTMELTDKLPTGLYVFTIQSLEELLYSKKIIKAP